MLRLSKLEKTWQYVTGPLPVLSGFSLDFPKSGRFALVSASGSGKSTLLRIIAGIERLDGGQITLDGNPEWRVPGRIVLLPQSPPLLPWLTIQANLEEVYRLIGRPVDQEAIRRQIIALKLDPYLKRQPYELSGGWKHLVAFAMATLPEPEVLLLDEPFASVDDAKKMMIWDQLAQIASPDRRLEIVVTHDLFEAVSIADEIIICIGPPLTVVERVRNERNSGGANLELIQYIRNRFEQHARFHSTM